jgi:hypothetical protein
MHRCGLSKHAFPDIMLVVSMILISCSSCLAAPRPATMPGIRAPAFVARDSGIIMTMTGDVVDFTYIGTYDNGTIFDKGTLTNQTIGNNNLLHYFDQNLVNREAGKPFSFAIPPDQGYQSGKMAGYTLHFQMTIIKVVRDGKEKYPTDTSPQNPWASIDGYPVAVVAMLVVAAVLVLFKKRWRAMIS